MPVRPRPCSRPIAAAFAFTALLMLAAAPVHAQDITGTIKSVDHDRDTFVVTVRDADTELEVDSSTSYEDRRGRRVEPSEALQAGNRVTVEYSGGVATRIRVVG